MALPWDRSAALITRVGDVYTTVTNNVTYTFSGVMNQEEVIKTDAYGATKVDSQTIVTVQTSDAVNIARQGIITRNGTNWVVDMKQLLGDGLLTKLTVKEQ